jgi:hypothetical protein
MPEDTRVTYQAEIGWRITCPATWEIVPGRECFSFTPDGIAALHITSERWEPGALTPEVLEEAFDSLADFETGPEEVEMAGLTGRAASRQVEDILHRAMVLAKGNFLFYISLTAPRERYPEYEAGLMEVLETLELP